MPYKYLDNPSGKMIYAEGENYQDVFTEGARALFDLMTDIHSIRGHEKVEITVQSEDMPSLFKEWLKELLSRKEINQMMFDDFSIASIQKVNDKQYLLMGFAYGEKIDLAKHKVKNKIKDLGQQGLKCDQTGKHYFCQCAVKI
jgi:SHS2 domain-containing protein